MEMHTGMSQINHLKWEKSGSQQPEVDRESLNTVGGKIRIQPQTTTTPKSSRALFISFFVEHFNMEMPVLQRKHKSHHASSTSISSNMNKSTAAHKSWVAFNRLSHCLLCISDSQKAGEKKKHFPLSSGASGIQSCVSQSHRAGICVMATSVLSALLLKMKKHR